MKQDSNARGGTGNGSVGNEFTLTITLANINGGISGGSCLPGGAAFTHSLTNQLQFCAFSPSPDVFGHEYAHVVTYYKSVFADNTFLSLQYIGEPGAINEGYSDLFGEFFEYHVTGTVDWINGTGALLRHHRNLANPPDGSGDYAFPDRFGHNSYFCLGPDNFGVHTNSAVLNKAGYLAAAGDRFNGFAIEGIGIEKLEQIMYRALTVYYGTDETFNQAYVDLRQAARDLYGDWSFEATQLTKALRAVEMDQPGGCSGLPSMLWGDLDLDHDIDRTDAAMFALRFGSQANGFEDPYDFDGDGTIGMLDLGYLQRRLTEAVPEAAASASVPEPSSLALTTVALLSLAWFVRQSRQRARSAF